jgi:urea transport system permease protein
MPRLLAHLLLLLALLAAPLRAADEADEPAPDLAAPPPDRARLVAALLAPSTEQVVAVRALVGAEDAAIEPVLSAWRSGELFLVPLADGTRVPATLAPASAHAPGASADQLVALAVADGKPVADPASTATPPAPLLFAPRQLRPLETTAPLRRAIRDVLEVAGVSDPRPRVRRESIERIGQSNKTEHLPLLLARLEVEKIPTVLRTLREAVALLQLSDSDPAVRAQACTTLGDVASLIAASRFKEALALPAGDPAAPSAADAEAMRRALHRIESHWSRVNFAGNLFRGLSAGSVLLLIALGLAITFGLMGVINMAHGELMVVGAYATFVTQNIFVSVFGAGSSGFHYYFIAALPAAFVSAALVGLVIERGVIQFLYKRPLESLLATWGVSLALQQTFRLIFGPANVQINAPSWLQGGATVADVAFAYNRLFVIGFAALVVLGVWLVLNRTPLGLLVRAVMQNRQMASCIGVRTTRVNMMTFAFGSGLAGLAGACLAQLGNVGPSMGQLHIIDSFMVVVSGGVGNVLGTVFAALGIGTVDQVLQPVLGPVMGKILVLFAIILFLQWRPGGLFPTRSRSLD